MGRPNMHCPQHTAALQPAGGADAVLPLLDVDVGAPGWPATSAAVNAEAARPVPVPGAFSSSRRFFVKIHKQHKSLP